MSRPHDSARSVLTLVAVFLVSLALVGTSSADVTFDLTGSLTSASSPFSLADVVSGSIVVKDAAAVSGNVSTTNTDVVFYSFTIGSETWSGTGADFLGNFQFTISGDGQTLSFENAGGGLSSSPGGFFLDIITNNPSPTEWRIGEGPPFFDQVAGAVGTMSFTRSMNSTFFFLAGSLTSAAPPFALGDAVSGFMTVKGAAAAPGHVSTTKTDVVSYQFTIGSETWSGTGADFLGIFQFTISGDGQTLSFENAGGGLSSSPGGFLLDIITNNPSPTEWRISEGPPTFDQVAAAVGTMSFTLGSVPGASGLGIGIVSIVMLGVGILAIRSRRRGRTLSQPRPV